MQSVVEGVGGDGFARIRIGIGRGDGQRDLVAHVLSAGSDDERVRLREMAERAAEAAQCVLDSGLETAMNRFNGRRY